MSDLFQHLWQPVPWTGCWVWTGALTKNSHRPVVRHERRTQYASRVFYRHFVGPIGDGLYVLHKCDNGLCVNPGHLFTGTQSDNMKDCSAKGRTAKEQPKLRGESSYKAKLTDALVREIRSLKGKETYIDMARRMGVNKTSIRHAAIGITWKHV
jgi:hypothetical protein